MAGDNSLEAGGVWVVSMGHLMGLFDHAWLGIRPTGKMAFLRYCEFNRIENNKICETAMYFDIPHLMTQVGMNPFPLQTAAHLVQPGPLNHDGLMFEKQDDNETFHYTPFGPLSPDSVSNIFAGYDISKRFN